MIMEMSSVAMFIWCNLVSYFRVSWSYGWRGSNFDFDVSGGVLWDVLHGAAFAMKTPFLDSFALDCGPSFLCML